jgi:S1-C subfamily serine protease
VRRVADDLRKYGEVRRGSIGVVEVVPLTTRLAEELSAPDTEGVVITRMERSSPAYRAGLRPGDIIKAVDGTPIVDPSQLVRTIADSDIGSTLQVEYLREGKRATVRVSVEQQQERPVRSR